MLPPVPLTLRHVEFDPAKDRIIAQKPCTKELFQAPSPEAGRRSTTLTIVWVLRRSALFVLLTKNRRTNLRLSGRGMRRFQNVAAEPAGWSAP